MKPYSDQYYVGYCSKNNEQYIKILQKNKTDDMLFSDVICEKTIDTNDLTCVHYKAPSKPLYKYLAYQFRKNQDERSAKHIELVETSVGILCIPLLRFFKLEYQELFEDTNTQETIERTVQKCKNYLKRHGLTKNVLDAYATQARKFANVIEVFSFLTNEIRSKVIPFWHTITCEVFPEKIVYVLSSGISTDVVEKCNESNLNLAAHLPDKEKYKHYISKIKNEVFQNICSGYKQKLLNAAHERLSDANSTLSQELEFAKSNNDQDLLQEVETIYQSVKQLEATIDKDIEDLPVTIDIVDWWPDLLYPAPKIVFERSQEFFTLADIEKYFFKNV
jgi:hypothetical protein